MRAAVYHGPGQPLRIETIDDPTPGPRQVVIQVERSGICGTDLHLTDGHGMIEAPPGTVLGHEYSGVVVARGSDAGSFSEGQRVTALAMPACGLCPSCVRGELVWCDGAEKIGAITGAYAEYVSVGAAATVALADGVSFELGALVEPLAVALHGVELSQASVGDSVVVLGAGPIALATVYWLRARGVDDITVVARSSRREAVARRMGARAYVAIGDDLSAAAAIGRAPIVFEAAGNAGALASALQLVRPRGTIVGMGFHDEPDPVIPALFVMAEVKLQFAMMYSRRDFEVTIDTLRERPVEAAQLITATVSLGELPTIFEDLRGASPHCKVMIAPQQ